MHLFEQCQETQEPPVDQSGSMSPADPLNIDLFFFQSVAFGLLSLCPMSICEISKLYQVNFT